MADRNVEIEISSKNNTQAGINSAKSGFANLKASIDRLKPSFEKMAVAGTVAFAGITAGVKSALTASSEAEAVQARLAQILRTSTGATDKQIASLNAQADALEKVGVVSADVIRQGQGQLASFDLQAESIQSLIPSILNYAVAEKGLNMTTEDLQSVTNGLAQALQGKFRSLEATGFVLDEETKAMISNGTETERVTALAKVLDSTYAGLNETMRGTTAGGIVGMQFALDKLKETIGSALSPAIGRLLEKIEPMIVRFTEWIERNPELVSNIIIFSGVLAGLTAVVGGLALALFALTSPFTLIALAITFIIGLIALIVLNFDKVKEKFNEFVERFKTIPDAIKAVIDTIIGFFAPFIKTLEFVISLLDKIINKQAQTAGAGQAVSGAFATRTKKVNDAIIQPDGTVIETHPDDYLIATKNPFSISGGKGSGATININYPTLLDGNSVDIIINKISDALRNELRI